MKIHILPSLNKRIFIKSMKYSSIFSDLVDILTKSVSRAYFQLQISNKTNTRNCFNLNFVFAII